MSNYTSRNATISIDQDMTDTFLGFLKTVIPSAEKIMSESLSRIEEEAAKDWPVRQPIIRTDKDGKITFFRRTTQESYKKFVKGVRADTRGNIVVFLKNTAPYSWAIKFGEDSKNSQKQDIIQPTGVRVANELLVKPQSKDSNNVVKALANDLMKKV